MARHQIVDVSMHTEAGGHVVVCGGGECGRALAFEFASRGEHVIVIERDAHRAARIEALGLAVVEGDATSRRTLERAELAAARGVVSTVTDDEEMLAIVAAVRAAERNVLIIALREGSIARRRALEAGADTTISLPDVVAEEILEALIPKPDATCVPLGRVGGSDRVVVEIRVTDGCILDGKSLLGARVDGLLPSSTVLLFRDDRFVVLGPRDDDRLRSGDRLVATEPMETPAAEARRAPTRISADTSGDHLSQRDGSMWCEFGVVDPSGDDL